MSDVVLLTAMVETDEGSEVPGLTMIKLSGEPHAAAIVNAVAGNYNRITGSPRPDQAMLENLIGEKVTLIQTGENMIGAGAIVAREGKLFAGSRGVAILPKGKRTRGYSVDPSRLLDVVLGYQADHAAELVSRVRGKFPQLRNLTQERLEQLPRDSNTCSLAVFGSNRLFDAPDCLWLIGEYWPEDDICDTNVLLIRPEFGTSEHGSCYGRELLGNRALGEVVGFEPIPFDQAIKLCNLDYDEALARVFRAACLA